MVNAENVLYRFYNSSQRLLYVGITSDPENRFRGHRADKPWWDDVFVITLTRYPDRGELAQAEIEAIESEHPKYNVAYAVPRETLNVTRTRSGRRGAHRLWNDASRFHTSCEDTPKQFKAPKLTMSLPCPICYYQWVYKDADEYGKAADELVRCPNCLMVWLDDEWNQAQLPQLPSVSRLTVM
jgi:hypothetical protein